MSFAWLYLCHSLEKREGCVGPPGLEYTGSRELPWSYIVRLPVGKQRPWEGEAEDTYIQFRESSCQEYLLGDIPVDNDLVPLVEKLRGQLMSSGNWRSSPVLGLESPRRELGACDRGAGEG